MALSLITSYYVAQTGSNGTGALTTPSFTPSNGEVIIVKLETWDTGTSMGTPTGGSQTYTSRIVLAPGGFDPWVGIFTAIISGSPGAMTISSTPSASARYSMCVERWSGGQLAATPVTGSVNGTGGAASTSMTPTGGSTSVISWVAGDAQSIDPSTRAYLGSGTDDGTRDDHVGANGTGYHGYQASTGSGSQSFGLSAPTGMIFGIVGIEVQASAGGNPPFPFAQVKQPRRLRGLQPRRGRSATAVRAQVNPPYPFTGIKQPRRLRGLLPRRGEVFLPVPAQVVIVPPKYPVRPVRTRLRGLRLFRGHVSAPVPAQVVVTAPGYPVRPTRPRVRGLRLFRSRSAGPVVDQGAAVPGVTRGRVKGIKVRGHVAQPVPAQTAVTAPAYPPQSVRIRVKGLRLFRGRSSAPVPGQIVVVAPTLVLQAVRARIKALRWSRGRAAMPVAGHQAPPAARVPRARSHAPAPRRGHAAMPPPPQIVVPPPVYPPQSVRTRLKGLRSARGREAATPVPAQVVIVPPKYPSVFSRLKQHAARIFRGATRTPVAPVCDCETHRPNLGVTTRLNSGITTRPGSGITARPGPGMTARPDSGTTDRPCTCQSGG